MTSEPQQEEDSGGSQRGQTRDNTCRAQVREEGRDRKGQAAPRNRPTEEHVSIKATIYNAVMTPDSLTSPLSTGPTLGGGLTRKGWTKSRKGGLGEPH